MLFRKKKIIDELEVKLEMVRDSNTNYKNKENGILNNIREMENKCNKAINSSLYLNGNEIFIMILEEKKRLFMEIEIEIYSISGTKPFRILILNSSKYSCEHVHIASIDTNYRYEREGHGSRAIQLLINYAKSNKFKRISGGILISDDIDKLYKFYSKNGFEVKETSFNMNI